MSGKIEALQNGRWSAGQRFMDVINSACNAARALMQLRLLLLMSATLRILRIITHYDLFVDVSYDSALRITYGVFRPAHVFC